MVVVRQKTVIQAGMSADCPSHSRANVRSRDVVSVIDEPLERGGTNQGLSPTETAVAALIGCTNVIAHKCAEKLGVDIGHTKISVVYNFDRRGVLLMEEVDQPFTKIAIKIETDGSATQQQLDAVAIEVARYCPIAKLFRAAGTEIEEEWVAAAKEHGRRSYGPDCRPRTRVRPSVGPSTGSRDDSRV